MTDTDGRQRRAGNLFIQVVINFLPWDIFVPKNLRRVKKEKGCWHCSGKGLWMLLLYWDEVGRWVKYVIPPF